MLASRLVSTDDKWFYARYGLQGPAPLVCCTTVMMFLLCCGQAPQPTGSTERGQNSISLHRRRESWLSGLTGVLDGPVSLLHVRVGLATHRVLSTMLNPVIP